MANRYYRNINDLINNSNKNIVNSITGDYSSLISKEGATQNQIDARLDAINLGKEKSIHKQIMQIQTELEGMGFGLRFSIDKNSGHIRAMIIPKDDSNYLSPEINKKDIEKYAALDFHIDIGGEVKKAGLRGKNHLIFDSDQSKVLGYTFVEAQLEEEIKFLRSKRGKELLRQTTSPQGGQDAVKEINKTIKKRGAGALEKMSLAGDSAQSISGTASTKNQALMASIMEAEKLFETAFRENYKMLSRSKQRGQSVSSFKEMIKKEAYIASYLLSQGVPVEKIKNDPSFQHIASSSGFLKTIKNFSNLGLHMGHTGEDAASDYQFTQLPQAVLTGGAFDEKSSRKRRQVTNTLTPNMTLKERMKLGAKRGGSLTKFEKKAGVSLDSAENATFGVRYVTQDDYSKAVKKTEEEFAKKGVKIKIREGIDSDAGIYASSMGKAFDGYRVTPSKFSRKDYDKIYSNLEKNNTSGLIREELEDEAIRVLIRDKYGYDDSWNGKLVRKDLSSNANFVKVDFEEMRKMRSGNKLLGQHANVRATFQEQEDEVFDALRRNLGLDKDAQIILGESKIGGKNISGVIAETLEGFVSRANEDKDFDLKNELSKYKLLDKFYTAKQDKSGNWVLEYKKSIEELDAEIGKISDEKGLGNFFKEINSLAKIAYNTTKDFFDVLNDGTVKRTKSWKGRSAYNQIDQYQYGAPEGRYTSFGHRDNRVVSLDYRGSGALEREMGLLESSTGKSRTALKTFLEGATAVDPKEIKRLRELQTNADESIKKTKQTAKEDFNINGISNATVVGWGDKPDDLDPNIQWINLADYENADNELSDGHMDARGFYDAAAFNKTSWAKIMDAQKRGDVYFKHNMGLVGYEDQYGNKILGTNNYVNLADLQVEADIDGVDAQGNPLATGYKINENTKKALSSMKFRTRDASSGEALDIEYGEESILEYLKTIFNDVNSKEGTSWQRGNKAHLFHSMFSKVNAANISGYYDLANKDNRTVEEDLELKLMTTAATGNIEDTREMLGFANKEEFDNPMDKFETLMLKYQKLYNFESEDDTYNRFLDYINKRYNSEERKKKDKEEAEAHYEKNKEAIREKWKSGNANSVYDLDSQTWVDFADKDEKRDWLLNKQEELKKAKLEEIENRKKFNSFDDIRNLTHKGSIRGVVDFLIEQMIDAVTLGSSSLDERIKGVEAAKAAGNNINLYGLAEIMKRYPESNGLDEKFVEIFLDKAVERGVTRLGIGLAKSFNADNDGDNIARYLALADSEQMGRILKAKDEKEVKEVVDSMYDAADMFSAINKVVAEREMRVRAEDEKSAGVIKPKDWQKLLDPNTQIITTVSSRINKSKTGSLSNEYQGVAEAMSFLGIDEKGVGKDLNSQKNAASAAIARALFESFTQDAISSKKVADRISIQRGESWAEEDSAFFGELDGLVADLSKPETYKNIDGLIARIQNMGILGSGSESVFTDRIESGLLATINRMSMSVDIFKDIFGEKTLLDAVGKDDIKDITQDDIDKAIASGSIKLTAEQLIPQLKIVNQLLDGKGGIGGVIRGRKWIVPGLLNATSNPVGMLGDAPDSLGAPYDALKEKVLGVKQAVDLERAAEEQKITVLGREMNAVKQTANEYNNLGDVLAKIAKQHGKTIEELTADDIEEGYHYLPGLKKPVGATQARKMMFGLEDRFRLQAAPTIMDKDLNKALELSKNEGRPLTEKELGETLGLRDIKDINSLKGSYSAFARGSFIGNTTQLIAELEKLGIDTSRQDGQTSEDYINHLAKLGQGVLADTSKYPGLSKKTANVIKSYVDKDNVDEHGEHSDIITLFGKLKNAEALFSGIDKSFKTDNILTSIENLYALLNKLGMLGGNLVGTEVGSSGVINGTPFATTADIVSTQTINKDGKEYTQLVHSDIKSHGGDNYTAEDAFQVAMEEYGTRDLIKTLASKPEAFSKDDKSFEAIQKEIIFERYRKARFSDDQIKNIIDSIPVLTKELASKLVETFNAGLDPNISRLIISNKNTGNATAYNTKLDPDKMSLLKKVFGGEPLSKEEAELFMKSGSFAGTTSKFKEQKKEPEKPKTKEDKEVEEKKNKEALVRLLDQEYKLRLKIAELKARKELSIDEKEKENIDKMISFERLNLTRAEEEREKAGDKVTDKDYTKNILLAREAEYQLEIQKLAERLMKEAGAGGIAGKKGLFSNLGRQFKSYFSYTFSVYRIMMQITQEIRKCVQITKELDKAATNIRIVTGMTKEEVDGLMRKYTGLARELGVTTQVVAQSGAEWMRQGYSAEQANDLIIASTKLSKLGMMDMNNATKVLTSTMKGFKLEASEVGNVVDKLTKLDMNYATTAADIGEAMSRTAAIANQMGVSLDETAAMVTTIMDITQQSAEMTGTAIRTILSRYGNVKAGSFVSMMTDGEDLDKINDIEKVLSALGIEIRESALDMKNIGSILDELAIKWVTLSDVEKNAVATAFAGTRQRNQFIVLMDNWKQVEEATEMAANSAGTADEKYGAYMDSIEARLNKLQTAWEGFTQKLGASKLIKGAVSALTLLVENLDKILKLVTSLGVYFGAKKLFGGISNKFGWFGGAMAKTGAAGGQGGISGIFNKVFNRTAVVNQRGFTDVNYRLQQIISIMQSRNMQDAVLGNNKNIIQALTFKERRGFIRTNKETIKKNEGAIKNFQKYIDKNNPEDVLKGQVEYRQDQNNMLKARNRALSTNPFKNFHNYTTADGQTITKQNGQYYSTVVGKDGKPVTTKIDKNSNGVKGYQRQKTTRAVGNVAMGVMAGFMHDTSQHKIGGSMYKSGKTSINDVETTKGENIAYKAIHIAGSTALNFIPFIGPIVSAVFGPMLTDLFTGLIKWAIHADEMERKERVRIAKENLEALKKIENATVDVKSTIYDMDTFEDVKKAQEAIDSLIITLLKDGDNRIEIMNALGEKFGYAINGATNQTIMSINDLEKILLYGTEEQKKLAVAVIDTVITANQAGEAAAAQEEEVWKAEENLKKAEYSSTQTGTVTTTTTNGSGKSVGGGASTTSILYSDITGNNILDSTGVFSKEYQSSGGGKSSSNSNTTITRTLAGNTNEEKYENALVALRALTDVQATGEYDGNKLTDSEKEWLDEEIKKLEKYVEEYTKYESEIEKLNKELHPKELAAAFNEAGLSLWDSVDIANSSLEGVIQRMADDLELTGIVVRDYTGQITAEARNQIETYLRSNEQFSSLFNNSATTLNDIISKFSDQADLLSKTGASSFDELKEAFDKQDAEKIETFTKNMYGASNATDEFKDKLMDLVYNADTSQLSYFARSLNMTTDQVLALQDKLGSVTLADLIKSPEETRESFNELAGMFSELSNGGKLTGESLEKLNSSYFSLYNTYDSKGKITSTSSDNLLNNLRERLFGNANIQGTQAFLYQNATFQELKGSSDMYDAFLASLKKNDIWSVLEEKDRDLLNGAKTLSDVIQLFNSTKDNGEGMQRVLSEFLDELGINNDYYKELQESLINWQKHENQTIISGLESQIDALEDINKEREKEIDLIKAKEALENAKKEKKRVYRAGVGWTYESNQEEITKAKDNLDELEREQNKENLQYQIDLLEKQNSMLDNISKNEELKALKNVFDEYNSYMKNKFGKEVSNGFSQILDLGEAQKKMTWNTYVTNMGTEQAYGEEKDYQTLIDSARQMAYLDSMLNGALYGKSEAEIEEIKHSSDYIAKQQARNEAAASFLSARSNLMSAGAKVDDINTRLKESINLSGSGYENLSNDEKNRYLDADNTDLFSKIDINEEYLYLHGKDGQQFFEGTGKRSPKDVKADKYVWLEPRDVYSDKDINNAINAFNDASTRSKVRIDWYNRTDKRWEIMTDPKELNEKVKSGDFVHMGVDGGVSGSGAGGEYAMRDGSRWREVALEKSEPYARGSFGIDKNVMAIINELGTEGIVTPSGTLTALPSKTGIVPADLTKNLYNLGEVAPNLIKKLNDHQIVSKNSTSSLEDNSMNVENFYATFETDNDFDFEKLLINARQYIKNTKGVK